MLNLLLVLSFPPAYHHSLTLPSVRFVRITGETEKFHQGLKETVKSFTEFARMNKEGLSLLPCCRLHASCPVKRVCWDLEHKSRAV